MKHSAVTFVTILGLIVISGCSVSIDDSNYKYHFKESINSVSCDTGEKEFDSKDAMCSTLQSVTQNDNGCARESRKSYFESQGCPGTFSDT